jgi:cortexillin 1/2
VDERSMVLYISLYFHAFTAREQQRGLLAEKDRIQQAMQGLQGTLEERAQLAERLDAENRQLKAELAEQREEMDRVQKASEDTANDLRARLKAAEAALAASEDQLARERDQQARIQMAGLGVLQQHLQTHVEDLRRWQKVLDLDQITEIDFSGEIRPQIAAEIAGAPFEKQLQALTERLEKENALLGDFLKQKEAEKKRAKQKEMDKKNRQESRK